MHTETDDLTRQHSFSTPSNESVTAADALATTSPLGGSLDCLYGSSSTIAFVRHVFHSTKKGINRPEDITNSLASSNESLIGQSHRAFRLGPDLDMLPRHRTADNYLRHFWEVVHPVFPVIHKPTFMALYDHFWEPDGQEDGPATPDEPVQLSILNLVFALGCQFSENVEPDERVALADQFYQRSRKLVSLDALDSVSISTVQSLLLTTIYLQSTSYSSRCWNTAGLAIRAAQGLGLHLDQRWSESANQLAREMRRRIWHVCVTIDRSVIF